MLKAVKIVKTCPIACKAAGVVNGKKWKMSKMSKANEAHLAA
jgi:hypothetical protein